MSDSVDALLGGEEEIGDYDLRDDEEDALLEEDDTYEQSRVINSVQEDAIEESGDILELSVEETLNDEEEMPNDDDDADFNDTMPTDDECFQRDKFASERVESSPISIAPDTTTRNPKGPVKQQQVKVHGGGGGANNRGKKRNMRGQFRGAGRGRGGYQGGPNRGPKMRPEGNKSYFINPHFKGNMQINAWEKKPIPQIQSWTPNSAVNMNNFAHQMPIMQPQQMPEIPFQQMQPPMQQMPMLNKPPVHQRLGFNSQPVNTLIPPPGPPLHYEPERQVTMHPLQMPPPSYPQNHQQYNQGPVFNHPPPPHFQPTQPIYNPQQQQQQHSFHQPPPGNYQPQFHQPPPQYHPPEPQHMPHIQPQAMFQNEHYSSFEPPPMHGYQQPQQQQEHRFVQQQPKYSQMPPQQNYNQRLVVNRINQNRMPANFNRAKKFASPAKRKERKPDGVNGEVGPLKRRIFENKNLQEVQTVDTTTPQIESNIKLEEEDEETKRLLKGIAEQKRRRELIVAQKEERRKIAAMKQLAEEQYNTVKSPMELLAQAAVIAAPVKAVAAFAPGPNLRVVGGFELPPKPCVAPAESKVEIEQLKSFLSNRKIFAKDNTLVDTSVVVVSNLAAGTTEVKLRKICNGVGDIQKFELSPKDRQATIQFKSVASAHAFYKKYQRFMLDLSMIQVTLKPQ